MVDSVRHLAIIMALALAGCGEVWPTPTAIVMREFFLSCVETEPRHVCIQKTGEAFWESEEELEYAIFGEEAQ